MAIVKMKRLRLLAMGADREKLLRLLQGMGCVEVDQADLDGEGASPELLEQLRDKVSRPDDRSLARAREGQSQAQRALAPGPHRLADAADDSPGYKGPQALA